ncbi:hypothetical protein CYMTET_29288 [Cymbomonas tetramitiformis]|uniref:LamG-like jellyroll fold domain-containing protein n=1 Tax=Cymbomonas tetramitiformis TaxID=36881 RepID=A0AAE0FL49_9CHLO|nr:hypothetical protein CYMTET_29288 [Cymbomonas tetramitiformis]
MSLRARCPLFGRSPTRRVRDANASNARSVHVKASPALTTWHNALLLWSLALHIWTSSAQTGVTLTESSFLWLDLQPESYDSATHQWNDRSNGYLDQGAGYASTSHTNAATYNANGYFTFDGTSNYLPLTKPELLTSHKHCAVTVGVWFRSTYSDSELSETGSNSGNWAFLDFDRSEYFNLAIGGKGQIQWSTKHDSTLDDMTTTTNLNTLNDGNWHYAVGTFSDWTSEKVIYVDGLEWYRRTLSTGRGSGLGRGSTNRYGFIGDGSEATSFDGSRNNGYFLGDVALVHCYSIALTPCQVAINYKLLQPTYGSAALSSSWCVTGAKFIHCITRAPAMDSARRSH